MTEQVTLCPVGARFKGKVREDALSSGVMISHRKC